MAQIMTVQEVLDEIKSKDGKIERFSKKKFEKLLKAAMNDPEFTSKVANTKKGELIGIENIPVGKQFRKWLQKIVKKAGIDEIESEVVLSSDFTIDSADGLYDFIANVIWTYMEAGNKFDFPAREDFDTSSISLREVEACEKSGQSRDIRTGQVTGTWKCKYKKHKELVHSSGCPEWLKSRA